MFNTNKEVRRRVSILLAFVMILSLCSGFGFIKNEPVWAAENTVTAGTGVSAASGSASVPTGPSVTVTPTPTVPSTEIPPLKEWRNNLYVRYANVTHVNGKTLEELDLVFRNKMFAGAEVTLEAKPFNGRGVFAGWEVKRGNIELSDTTSRVTSFIMTDERSVEIEAVYDNRQYSSWPSLRVAGTILTINGETLDDLGFSYSGRMFAGAEVTVKANESEYSDFLNWRLIRGNVNLVDPTSKVITFIMPDEDVILVQNTKLYWYPLNILNGNFTKVDGDTLDIWNFEFNNEMFAGAEVTIEADVLEGKKFVRWEVVSGNVELADPTSSVTTFIMQKEAVELKACYENTSEYAPIDGLVQTYMNLELELFAFDSAGNRVTQAKPGEQITIKTNPNCAFLQKYKLLGFRVYALAENGEVNWDNLVLEIRDVQNGMDTCTFTMPEVGVHIRIYYTAYLSKLSISNGKLIKAESDWLGGNFEFKNEMVCDAKVTIEADNIANAIFVKWASNNDEVKFADPYARTTTFVMPKSDTKVYALYEYYEVSKPTPAPSTPDVEDKEDTTGAQQGSKPETGKDAEDSTKPEEVKNPDVITEKDVYTKEEQEKLAAFKLPQVSVEVKEKVEAFVQAIQNFFFKVTEEVKEKLAENITMGTAPATEHSLATALNNNPVDLMSKSLSAREQKRIEAGEKLNLYMEVKDATETVSKQEKILIEKTMQDISAILNEGKAEGAERKTELGMYLDLNLMKQIGNDKAKKVARPKGDVDVSIQVPENLLNKEANVQRLYQIICVYNGKSVLLDTEFNVKTNALSFKTNKFTTFALIYTDVPVEKKTEK